MKKIKIYHKSFWSLILLFFINSCANIESKSSKHNEQSNDNLIGEVWSVEKANEWGKNLPWLRGANFNPSTAINQLEFWQGDTFDPETIDRELGWASDIGMNCMRVYLHHAAWKVDRDGFKKRISKYLTIASKHSISTIFVFFDDCWNSTYQSGKQPEPKPGVHNSGWIMDPGDLLFTTENLMPTLEEYVTDILKTFKNNDNIILWDLYNEPGNSGRKNRSLPLLKNVFKWARKVNPKQPLTVGVWSKDLEVLNKFQLENSDIISYHNYNNEMDHQNAIDSLNKFNRPMMCTEYMARRNNSLFSNIMPILKKQKIGAINWGLVTGKSNTKYAWDEPIPDGSEPALWFHDIFYKNGVPYKNDEVELIKKLSLEK